MNLAEGPWPKCVGMTGENCKNHILANAKDINSVDVIPQDSMVTMDFSTSRVRVFIDDDGIVVMIPKRG